MTHSRALHHRPCAHKKYWGQRGKLKKAFLSVETWGRKVVVVAEQAKALPKTFFHVRQKP